MFKLWCEWGIRQHFVRFEDSLLGNKAGKSEGHQVECTIESNLASKIYNTNLQMVDLQLKGPY